MRKQHIVFFSFLFIIFIVCFSNLCLSNLVSSTLATRSGTGSICWAARTGIFRKKEMEGFEIQMRLEPWHVWTISSLIARKRYVKRKMQTINVPVFLFLLTIFAQVTFEGQFQQSYDCLRIFIAGMLQISGSGTPVINKQRPRFASAWALRLVSRPLVVSETPRVQFKWTLPSSPSPLPSFAVVTTTMLSLPQRERESPLCREFNLYFAEPTAFDDEPLLRCDGYKRRLYSARSLTPPKQRRTA